MSKEKLSKALSGVARLRLDLDGATDALNEKIAEFEKEFGAIAGGTRVEVVTEHDEDLAIHESLVFSKYNGNPRLLLVDGSTAEDIVTPISSASRADRIMAVNHFPELIEGLEKALQAQLIEVASGTRLAEECIEVVREANQGRTLRQDVEAAYERVAANAGKPPTDPVSEDIEGILKLAEQQKANPLVKRPENVPPKTQKGSR